MVGTACTKALRQECVDYAGETEGKSLGFTLSSSLCLSPISHAHACAALAPVQLFRSSG